MKTILALALLVFSGAAGADGEHAHHMGGLGDPAATHGMLVTGTSTVYLSHLPMFHRPHDYQVIVEADLGNATAVYLNDRNTHPHQTVYTLVPETFVLPEMIQNPRPFRADLFRGHFERGGIQIAGNAVITIKKVIYFTKFNPNAAKPDQLTYLLFGRPNQAFLAHIISAKPDFDHVVSTVVEDPRISDLLKSGVTPMLEVENTAADKPLDTALPVTVHSKGNPALHTVFKSMEEQYLEFDDLSQ